MTEGRPQLTRSKHSSNAVAQSLPPHVVFLETNVTALLNLSVTDMTQSKQSGAVEIDSSSIKLMVIIWKGCGDEIIGCIDS